MPEMKARFFSILMLLAFAVRPAYYVGQFSYYAANIDYIIETYCINKERPQLNCDGKCYLAKQLKGGDIGSSVEDGGFLVNAFFPVFHISESNNLTEVTQVILERMSSLHLEMRTQRYYSTVYRPPIV